METSMWEAVLSAVRADALDCLQANLAVLVDRAHGAGTHVRWGARISFDLTETDGLPSALPDLEARLAEAAGLRVRQRWAGTQSWPPPSGTDPLYVVADAFYLPWVPYFRHRHIEHSFLVVADGVVVDAYHVDTPHGSARPGFWEIDAGLIQEHATEVITFEPVAVGEPDAAVRRPERSMVDRYVAAYRDFPDRAVALDRLTVETWSLARSRLLHAYWTEDQVAVDHAAAWAALAQQVYLAHRRVDRGRPEPRDWPDRLAELLLAAPGVGDLRAVVVDVVTEVLGVAPPMDGELARLPGFNSFRMVEILERIEHRLGLEVPAAELVPKNLTRVGGLVEVFERCQEGAPA